MKLRRIWILLITLALLSLAPALTVKAWADGPTGTTGTGLDPGDPIGPGDEGDPDYPQGGSGKTAGKPSGYTAGQLTAKSLTTTPSVPTWRTIQLFKQWMWMLRLQRPF